MNYSMNGWADEANYQMNWLETQQLKTLIKDHAMELLTFHQTAEWNSLARFGGQKNIMITVSMTLIAAGTAAVAGDTQIIVLAVMVVPVFVAMLRQHTIETLDRYYARFLEAAVVQSKLRFALGLGSDLEVPFSDDEFLEVARRGINAPVRLGSALWIREYLGKGHNDVVWRIFRALCCASALLPLAAGARLYTWPCTEASLTFLKGRVFIVVVVIASLLALVWIYSLGTGYITKKRDEAYGQLPNIAA